MVKNTQTFIKEFGEEFERTFGSRLQYFTNVYYGFDILRFEEIFAKENAEENKSLKDYIAEKYSPRAAQLLSEMLTFFTSSQGLNKELAEVEDGTNAEYKISLGGLYSSTGATEVRFGTVYYPFAISKHTYKYSLDHLPTGHYFIQNVSKSDALEIIHKLHPWKQELSTESYSTECFLAISEIVNEYRT